MKHNKPLLYTVLLLVAVGISSYYMMNVESFETTQPVGNTLHTLLNLPSWLVYVIIGLVLLLTFFSAVYPWVVGFRTAGQGIATAGNLGSKWINAAYGRRTTTVGNTL